MKALVIYDTLYGNTERIAQTIADALRPFGQVQTMRIGSAPPVSFQDVDLLIVGSPTQGFRPTPAVQFWLEALPSQQLSNLAIVCFDTRFRGFLWKRSAASWLSSHLRARGFEELISPESFFVKAVKKEGPLLDGEVERSARWALHIHQHYEVQKESRAVKERK